MNGTHVKKYKVDIVESEQGWGATVDSTIYFDTEIAAKDYVTKFNETNNRESSAGAILSWYTYATEPKEVFVEVTNEIV